MHHLTEDEHTVSVCLEARQQFVQQHHLTAVHNQATERFLTRRAGRFDTIEEVRMVRRLFQLDSNVEQRELRRMGAT